MNNPTPNTPPTPPSKKFDAVGAIVFFIAIGLACMTSFGEMWPTTKLIELQARIFDGSYYPKMTFLLTLLIFLLPMLGIYWVVKKMMKK